MNSFGSISNLSICLQLGKSISFWTQFPVNTYTSPQLPLSQSGKMKRAKKSETEQKRINFSHVEVVSNFVNVSSRAESSNSKLSWQFSQRYLLFSGSFFILRIPIPLRSVTRSNTRSTIENTAKTILLSEFEIYVYSYYKRLIILIRSVGQIHCVSTLAFYGPNTENLTRK